MTPTRLSKSRFMSGWQCLKRLYLEVYRPKLATPLDKQTLAIMEQGQEVGRWARKAFPGGTLIDAGHDEMEKALAQTEAALRTSSPAIFEATFSHQDVLARVDILERPPDGQWRLIEVKSSTSLKEYHLYDVTLQSVLLEELGMNVLPCLMHLNREYVYDGQQYDLAKLFVIREVADATAPLREVVRQTLDEERRALAASDPPDVAPGKHCTHPFSCPFYEICNQELPIDHLLNLPALSGKKQALLTAQAITSIGQIPKSFPLTERQRHAWECIRSGRPWYGPGLKAALAGLCYPLYFMDFETAGPALPRYAGMSPYDAIPFQWSVHVLRTPQAELEHFEFLADGGADPRPEFARSLCGVMGDQGSVIAYSAGFESSCLAALARVLPEYQSQTENIRGRLWDLLTVVRDQVYHAEFRGSYSLKSVLPALVPGMTYHGLAISEGSQASLAWEQMRCLPPGNSEREELRAHLLTYCGQDTLAMVRLLEVLQAG